MEQRSLIYQNKKLSYRVKGKGEAIVLLHGFGEDGAIWKNQFDAFEGFCLMVPDLPGSGGSELIEDMSMEGMAASILAILNAETISHCILIGHSMGGYVTLAFVEKYEAMVKGFGLFHSSAYADSEEKKETRRKGISFINKNGAAAFLRTSTPNLYSPATKKNKDMLIEAHLQTAANFSDAALINYYEAMINRPDRTSVLKNSRVPVLCVLGREDTAVPLKDGLKQSALPSQAHVFILENSGHMGMVEEPRVATECVTSFVSCISKPLKD